MGDGRLYAAVVARRPFPALKSADSPSPPKPTSISAQVEGSGTGDADRQGVRTSLEVNKLNHARRWARRL